MALHLIKSFNQAADTYQKGAFISNLIAQRLLARLDLLKQSPERILDLGCGDGKVTQQLHQKFPSSNLIGVDFAESMLQKAQTQVTNSVHFIKSYAERLPLASQSIDLLFSNCLLHWCPNIPLILWECQRILKANGTLFFAFLGTQSFIELRDCLTEIDKPDLLLDFVSVDNLGDTLDKLSFSDVVIDKDFVTLTYPSLESLFVDFKLSGANNIHLQKKLILPKAFQALKNSYEKFKTNTHQYQVTLEIIYLHAMPPTLSNKDGVNYISADKIALL